MIKEHAMLPLLAKLIRYNKTKRRRNSNGSAIVTGTNQNYEMLSKLLQKFEEHTKFKLVIYEMVRTNKREQKKVQKYWQVFYTSFTDYLYNTQNCNDNYVGQNIKLLKAFLNWTAKDLGLIIGQEHKKFYVPHETIPIIVLEPQMLNFLIYSKDFTSTLSLSMNQIKDLFVFGCTVGLRYSDLKELKHHSVERIFGRHYLVTVSQKTRTPTKVMLPRYAVDIIEKYSDKKRKLLLPYPSIAQFNLKIKRLIEIAGWTHEVPKIRTKRGSPHEIKCINNKHYRYCDLVSSHCMRKTAITTLLRLGLNENLVRKISGHSPGSKAFYKYVELSQSYMDEEIGKAHDKLAAKFNHVDCNS